MCLIVNLFFLSKQGQDDSSDGYAAFGGPAPAADDEDWD